MSGAVKAMMTAKDYDDGDDGDDPVLVADGGLDEDDDADGRMRNRNTRRKILKTMTSRRSAPCDGELVGYTMLPIAFRPVRTAQSPSQPAARAVVPDARLVGASLAHDSVFSLSEPCSARLYQGCIAF